jgi:hypothetical protein
VTDVHGMPSYGELVKEKTFGSSSSSSTSSSSGSGSVTISGAGHPSGLKLPDGALDRQVVFTHCSLSAVQVTPPVANSMSFGVCYAAPSVSLRSPVMQLEVRHDVDKRSQVRASTTHHSTIPTPLKPQPPPLLLGPRVARCAAGRCAASSRRHKGARLARRGQ